MLSHYPQARTAFEQWVSVELKQRFDAILQEPLPADLADLLDDCAA